MGKTPIITVNNTRTFEWRPHFTIDDVCVLAGYPNKQLTVFLNGKVINRKDYHVCQVPQNASIKIMYIAQGG
jgi:sulfur carrier protein ThiS